MSSAFMSFYAQLLIKCFQPCKGYTESTKSLSIGKKQIHCPGLREESFCCTKNSCVSFLYKKQLCFTVQTMQSHRRMKISLMEQSTTTQPCKAMHCGFVLSMRMLLAAGRLLRKHWFLQKGKEDHSHGITYDITTLCHRWGFVGNRSKGLAN